MNRFEKFDEEIKKEAPIDESVLKKKKRRTRLIKRGMLFFVKLFLYHFAAMIIYGVALSAIVAQDIRDGMDGAGKIILLFSIAAILLFALIVAFDLAHDGEEKRSFTDLARTEKYSLRTGARLSLPEAGIYTAIYFVFQIPFAIFHHAFGFDHTLATGFEKYYMMDIGFMELTGVGFLGVIIDCAIFFLCFIVVRHFIYSSWNKDKIEK